MLGLRGPRAGAAGTHPSLAIGADGLPVIAYVSDAITPEAKVKLVRCAAPDCSGAAPRTIDASNGVKAHTSLTVSPSGLPVVTYLKQHDLVMFALCTSPACPSSLVKGVVSGAHHGSSVTIGADGNPVIASFESDRLVLVHCRSPLCGSYRRNRC